MSEFERKLREISIKVSAETEAGRKAKETKKAVLKAERERKELAHTLFEGFTKETLLPRLKQVIEVLNLEGAEVLQSEGEIDFKWKYEHFAYEHEDYLCNCVNFTFDPEPDNPVLVIKGTSRDKKDWFQVLLFKPEVKTRIDNAIIFFLEHPEKCAVYHTPPSER